MNDAPVRLSGVHHLKLPVRDLERSVAWYESRLGYVRAAEFVERGVLMGVSMRHPAGGPDLAFRLDPERAAAAAGFDYFAIGADTREDLDRIAAHLTALGEEHEGVHRAGLGWILPLLHDPDGHEVRFYTHWHHTDLSEGVHRFEDPRETAEAAEAAEAAERQTAGA